MRTFRVRDQCQRLELRGQDQALHNNYVLDDSTLGVKSLSFKVLDVFKVKKIVAFSSLILPEQIAVKTA